MTSFLVFTFCNSYAHSHPDNSSKRRHYGLKKCHILLKIVLLKLNLQHEGQLYANCLIYILTIYHKCLLFQFLGRGIRMQIPTLTRAQKEHISFRKGVHNLLKNALLKFNFQHEGHLYANFLFSFLSFCFASPLFSSLVVTYVCTFPS